MRKKAILGTFSSIFIVCLSVLIFSCKENVDGQQKFAENTALLQNPSVEIPAINIGEISAVNPKDTHVLLTVDTENITEETKNDFVVISDNRSDPSGSSGFPSEHIALVDKNMKIYWSAVALNPQSGTTVDVLGIFRKAEGGSEILDGVFLDPNKDGIVMGKIKNKKVDGLEYYDILIRINEESPRTFVIDPKLQMSY
jgi:hypothetical protein